MDARAKSVRDILHAGDQYLIPFFQRHYSWKLKNWQRLWEDVRGLMADGPSRNHFLGPLVCTPVNHVPGELPQYQLIDGQQRLTTITTLLAALRDLAVAHKLTDMAEDITESFLIHKRKKGLSRFKLVPRIGDREVLFAMIDGPATDQSRRDGIIRAYRYFEAAVGSYVAAEPEARLNRIVQAVTAQLSLVVITVDGENPYEIFESLNSTGLPLAESDLIRNFVFMRVALADQEEFFREHWQPFEAQFEATDDADALDATSFYRDYLMRDGTYSRKGSTFVDFKDQWRLRDATAEQVVEELRRYSRFWLLLRRAGSGGDAEVSKALADLAFLEIRTSHPLLINLLARWSSGILIKEELLGCLDDLASFVIRRSICGESTRGYGDMFPAAIKAIKENTRDDLRKYWVARGWPDDAAFTRRLVDFALYRRERSKCELILHRLESAHGHKEAPDTSALTIEHVLPQTIGEGKHGRAWQEVLGDEWQQAHELWVHTLGNLTLTGYNANMSNRPFERKREELAKSNVQLNRAIAKLDEWNVKAIETRGRQLAKRVAQLWPYPEGAVYVPGEPDRDGALAIDDRGELKALWVEYWKAFLAVLATVAPELQPKRDPGDRRYVVFASDRARSHFAAVVDAEEASVNVELCFRSSHAATDLQILRQDEAAIESELGYPVDWLELGDRRATAAIFLDSAQPADRADWERQHRWLADRLAALIRVLGPRVSSRTRLSDAQMKSLQAELWTAVAQRLATAIPELQLPKPKSRTTFAAEIDHHTSLLMQVDVDRNWLWAGLEFEGEHAEAEASRLVEVAGTIDVGGGTPTTRDSGDGIAWLGSYRLAMLGDKSKWTDHVGWLERVGIAFAELAKKERVTR